LSIIEKLCNYGVHYYEVKDKANAKWYLGISYRGIGLYESNNKIIPKKIFPWSKLENLYYRDRKFSIEVHESAPGVSAATASSTSSLSNALMHHNGHNTSAATSTTGHHHHQQQQQQHTQLNGLAESPNGAESKASSSSNADTFNPVKVYAWFAAIPSLCKSIWLMAVAQHQFYLDKKQNRVGFIMSPLIELLTDKTKTYWRYIDN
jgi:hypothetical protein